MPLNCDVREDFWESLYCKEIQSVNTKGINPDYSLEGLMVKLKPQYFGHMMLITGSLEMPLMLGNIEGRRRRVQRMRWLNGINDSMNMILSKLWEMVMDMDAWCTVVHGVTKSQTQLINWTATNDKPTANIIIIGEKLKALSLRSGASQRHSLLSLLFNIFLEFSV